MPNAFIRKLECFAPLCEDDRTRLSGALTSIKQVGKHVDLVREGDRSPTVHVIIEGFACRYKALPDGARQIFAYLVPGDSCDLHTALLQHSDHSIQTLSECVVGQINRADVLTLVKSPAIERALWWNALVEAAVLREWVTSIGARRSEERIAHLFCELHARLKAVGLISDGEFDLPVSQEELGHTVGISTVHVNRSLKALREAGLVSFRDRTVRVLDAGRLREFSSFDPNYLHLE